MCRRVDCALKLKKLGKAKKREGDGEGGEDCKTFFSLWCQEIFVILVKKGKREKKS